MDRKTGMAIKVCAVLRAGTVHGILSSPCPCEILEEGGLAIAFADPAKMDEFVEAIAEDGDIPEVRVSRVREIASQSVITVSIID